MRLIGLMCARNEDWIIGTTARAALMWLDHIVILNHASTDRTVEIIADIQREHATRVHVISVPVAQWDEMEHRQMTLERARCLGGDLGGTHIAIVDCDEILTGNLLSGIRDAALRTPRGSMLQLPLYNLRRSLCKYHANGIWGRRIVSVAFKDDSAAHWKGDNFHHREPHGVRWNPYEPIQQGQGGVMHLWGACERRLKAKHALYKCVERLRWPNKPVQEIDTLYSLAMRDTGWTFADTPESWWFPYRDLMQYLDISAEPWQESEVRKLVELHGKEVFRGLDLFGVVI